MRKLFTHIDIRDAHVYGGLLLVAMGFAGLQWEAGLVVLGGGLLYLGLRRP